MSAPVPPPYPAPDPQYPGAAQYPAPRPAPSRALAITGLVLALLGCTGLVGLVLGIITLVKSRGTTDSASKAMGWIAVVIGALWVIGGTIFGIAMFTVWDVCQDYGNGVHHVNGVTYTCNI